MWAADSRPYASSPPKTYKMGRKEPSKLDESELRRMNPERESITDAHMVFT